MAQSSKTKSTKKRVKIKDLPVGEKKLSKKEQQNVKGGLTGQTTIGPKQPLPGHICPKTGKIFAY